jgi:hypothetical protein
MSRRRQASQRRIQEKRSWEGAMEVLIGFAFLAGIWIIVLVGSRYFGPT